jgi:prevent-host-death family protein
MQNITANELKTQGVQRIATALEGDDEAIISVRGKEKYVVMPIEKYHVLRECELETALNEVRAEVKRGDFVKESVEDHIRRIRQ